MIDMEINHENTKQELAKMERVEKRRVIIAVGMFAVLIFVIAGTIYKLLTT